MTTTTRTTRRAPWAVFLTALLAVVAMLFGALAFAGVANAKDNGNGHDNGKTPPGQSETFVPPGQDDNAVPPGQQDRPDTDKKVWICHADTNKGQGQENLGQGGTGGEFGIGFNLIYISVNAAENAHFKLHPNDVYAPNNGTSYYCPGTPTPEYTTTPVCVANADGTFGTVVFKHEVGTAVTTGVTDDAAATPYASFTVVDKAKCTPTVLPKTLTVEYCAALLGTDTYGKVVFTGTEGTDEATWLAGTTPKSAYLVDTTGLKCLPPEAVAAIDAAVAAAVPQPATIGGEPATVEVPATGPALPAQVPAGDGSTTQTPVALLALLALGALGVAASAATLAARRTG